MSEIITIETVEARIHGSIAGAIAYLVPRYTGWSGLATSDSLKRRLVRATDLLSSLTYVEAADSFAKRDAIDLGTDDGDAAFPFRAAMYELARLSRTNPNALTLSQGNNVSSISDGGGASVSYFTSTSVKLGTALPLPASVMHMIEPYLLAAGDWTPEGPNGGGTPSSSTGACALPFGPWGRTGPY